MRLSHAPADTEVHHEDALTDLREGRVDGGGRLEIAARTQQAIVKGRTRNVGLAMGQSTGCLPQLAAQKSWVRASVMTHTGDGDVDDRRRPRGVVRWLS